MLVAYGIRRDGRRHLLAFLRSQGEGQADWEALLGDLYRRGLEGKALELILTDGCAGLAAAIRTVYPRMRHQRCWVHKMRNILEKARKRDYDEVKAGASGDLSGREPGASSSRLSHLPLTLMPGLPRHGPATAAGPAGGAVVLRFSPPPVAQAALHQRNRALFCRGASPHPAYRLLRQRRSRKRGPNHLLHLPEIQSGMENPHPLRIYTSSLTSLGIGRCLTPACRSDIFTVTRVF
jgi:hypothetical protein